MRQRPDCALYTGLCNRTVCRIPPLRPAHALGQKIGPVKTSRAGRANLDATSLSRDCCADAPLGPLCNAVDCTVSFPGPQNVRCLVQTVPICTVRATTVRAVHRRGRSTRRQRLAVQSAGLRILSAGLQPAQRTHPIQHRPGNALTPTRITARARALTRYHNGKDSSTEPYLDCEW